MRLAFMLSLASHEASKLLTVLLHNLHRRFHLALATLHPTIHLLANPLEELGILLYEREYLLALCLRHILHLHLECLTYEEFLYHMRAILA